MEISLFAKMVKDKYFYDLSKLRYKYSENIDEFLKNLRELYCKNLPIEDFNGNQAVYMPAFLGVDTKTVKLLLKSRNEKYSIKAAEEEIAFSGAIENIDYNRESIRSILKGFSPKDESETRILGQKNGVDFICNLENKITEENIHKLYMMTVGSFLDDDEKLKEGCFYRHDTVYIVSNKLEHAGIPHNRLPEYMKKLVMFINQEDGTDDLVKAAIIHFYLSYLHPYFDGNGRMARFLHLWFLIQKGYEATLFVPFSSYIHKSRKEYYKAFTAVEENAKISGMLDLTPFIKYFIDNVYNKINEETDSNTLQEYKILLEKGEITEKENKLWAFVLSNYGLQEFSTKKLEKDYSDVSYATVRSFVLKFERFGLLQSRKFSNRVRYKVK